jgi:hypothetical protein
VLRCGLGCGGCCSCVGCDAGAADVGGDVSLDEKTVGGLGGGGPLEGDLVADALGGEVGDGAGEVEGWWARWAGAGAAGQEDGQVCDEQCGEGRGCGAVGWRVAGVAHLSQPSILSDLAWEEVRAKYMLSDGEGLASY